MRERRPQHGNSSRGSTPSNEGTSSDGNLNSSSSSNNNNTNESHPRRPSGSLTARDASASSSDNFLQPPRERRRRVHTARDDPGSSHNKNQEPTVHVADPSGSVDDNSASALPRLGVVAGSSQLQPHVQWQVKPVRPDKTKMEDKQASSSSKPSESATTRLQNETNSAASALEVNGTSGQSDELLQNELLRSLSVLLRDRYEGKRSLRLAFRNWDRDKDGLLSGQEVRDMIHALGFAKKLGRHQIEEIITVVQKLPNGSLQYQDFTALVYCRQGSCQNKDSPLVELASSTSADGNASASDKDSNTVNSGSNGNSNAKEDNKTASASVASSHLPVESSSSSTTNANTTDAKTVSTTTTHKRDEIVLGSDQSLYADMDQTIKLLRKKYESRRFQKVFRDWDFNKNGFIDLHELNVNLRHQGIRLSNRQLQDLIANHDDDHDGRLSYNEFLHIVYGPINDDYHNDKIVCHLQQMERDAKHTFDPYRMFRNPALEETAKSRVDEGKLREGVEQKLKVYESRMNDVFVDFDDDGNGSLSYAEFREGLKEVGVYLTEQEFCCLARLVDTDQSGEISFREFSNLFNHKYDQNPNPSNANQTTEKKVTQVSHRDGFDFLQIARRMKRATRFGKTPLNDTKELLSGPATTRTQSTTFQTESQLYGGGINTLHFQPRPSVVSTHGETLGLQHKELRNAAYTKRLDRLREATERHECQARERQERILEDAVKGRRTITVAPESQSPHRTVPSKDQDTRPGEQVPPKPSTTRPLSFLFH